MKAIVLQENLKKGLQAVAKSISSRPQLPILSNILLEFDKSNLTISATDMFTGIRSSLFIKGDQIDRVVIPAKQLIDAVNHLSPGNLEIELIDNTLSIVSNGVSYQLPGFSADEFPDFPKITNSSLSFKLTSLEKILSFVGFSAASDQARLILTAVLFEKNESSTQAVTTDGFRLSILNNLKNLDIPAEKILIPLAGLREVIRVANLLQVSDVTMTISPENKQILMKLGETELFLRLIEGEYPPYSKIVPTSVETEIEISAEELQQKIKQALVVAKEVSQVVTFTVAKEKMLVQAKAAAKGVFSGEIDYLKFKGEELAVSFNAQYWLDLISSIKPKEIVIGFNGSFKPARVLLKGNENYQYIVMPFKLNS